MRSVQGVSRNEQGVGLEGLISSRMFQPNSRTWAISSEGGGGNGHSRVTTRSGAARAEPRPITDAVAWPSHHARSQRGHWPGFGPCCRSRIDPPLPPPPPPLPAAHTCSVHRVRCTTKQGATQDQTVRNQARKRCEAQPAGKFISQKSQNKTMGEQKGLVAKCWAVAPPRHPHHSPLRPVAHLRPRSRPVLWQWCSCKFVFVGTGMREPGT